jgi:glutamyl/glutaminyl-tRNA synthetase
LAASLVAPAAASLALAVVSAAPVTAVLAGSATCCVVEAAVDVAVLVAEVTPVDAVVEAAPVRPPSPPSASATLGAAATASAATRPTPTVFNAFIKRHLIAETALKHRGSLEFRNLRTFRLWADGGFAPRQDGWMKRVRFAPSPTGTLHIGNALSAVANRAYGEWMLLRIDDTDPARNVPGGEQAIIDDLGWLGVGYDEGPARQSERAERHREAAGQLGVMRFEGLTLLRDDGSPTYQLATVVDDIDFGITHVLRGNDHRPNEVLHRRLHEALGTEPPEYVHHGLILGADGKKLSKRAEGATVASLREAGIPAEAVRAYLEELGIPRHDVHLDLARVRRLAVEAIEGLSDEDLASRVDADPAYAPVMRGARDLNEARDFARQVAEPESVTVGDAETLARFEELADLPPRELLRELKAAGGDLKALRLALTGREKGPELRAILEALPREEALRRVRSSRARP